MSKMYLLITEIIGVSVLFIAGGIYAGTKAPKVIKLDNKAYAKHKERIVVFEHKKHAYEIKKKYPWLYKAKCGECHHDDKNKPRVNLKEGDNVKKCIECHKKPQYVKAKKAKRLSKKQKREYHANALHDNCKDCHKKYNKKYKKTAKTGAPTTCKTCHAKKKA